MSMDQNHPSLPVSQGPRSVMALFADDENSIPLWFKKDAFAASDFNSETYIADLRKFVPLDTLRAELRSHLRLLKSELVELINRDYTDFVNLSTKLVDVDGAVLRMRMPLNDLRGKLLSVRESVNSSLLAIQDGLKRRAEASESREILELLLDTSHVVSKIEKLLVELETIPEEGSAFSQGDMIGTIPLVNGILGESAENVVSLKESRSQLVERIASEMNRLKFYVARVQDLPFIQHMEKRIQNASKLLGSSLQQCFEVGLECREETVILRCLRAYAAIDNTEGAHEVFRVFVVTPLMQQIISAKEIDADHSDLLEGDLNVLKKLIKENCKFLLDIAVAANSGVHTFEFLANSILKELHSAILKGKPGAFSPGKPAEFLANYKASLEFLDYLEGYCPSKSSISTFRSQSAYTEFVKQWNLGVYFTLRFQEIAGALDSALSIATVTRIQDSQTPGVGESFGLALVHNETLLSCLQRCWKDDVFVLSLSDKFLGLSLQLLSRYATWLSTGLNARKSGNSSIGGDWALAATPEDFLLMRHDVDLLVRVLRGSYWESISKLLQSHHPEVLAMVQQSVMQGGDLLMQVIPAVTDVIIDIFVKKCVEVLTQLKGITAMYRMTNKPLPVRHSSYVSGILHSLKTFLEGEYTVYLSSEDKSQLVIDIVERVTTRFDDLARELLTVARKTESSLQRFRQGIQKKGTTGTDSSESISDTDKICKQLFLDVQEYGRRLHLIGINADKLPAFISLWQCVAPSDKQGQIIF